MSDLDDLVQEELARFRVPGAAVAVVKDGEVVLERGFGYRNAEQGLPVTEQTLFPIGSTTKAFTAAVIGALVDEGVLEWDRPVREYVPDFELSDPLASRELTVRDMLSHRSGLSRHDALLLMYGGGGLSRAELIKRLRHLAFNKSFREVWQYNNLIYMAVGHLIEVVAGQTWEEAVQQRLLDPLNMTNTNFFIAELQKDDDHSLGQTERDGEIVEVPFRNIEIIGPAGSINSCIADMSRWLLLNAEGATTQEATILSAQALKEIQSPAITVAADGIPWTEVKLVGYALGWLVEDFRGHRHIWHNGGVDGFKTIVSFIPEKRVGVVVLSNRFPSSLPEAMTYRILEQLLTLKPLPWGDRFLEIDEAVTTGTGDTRERRRARSKDAPPTHPVDEYAGSYHHPGYGTISFALDGDELVADLHDLHVTLQHRHYNVWDAHEPSIDLSIPFSFAIDLEGEIASVQARLEPTVDPIVFHKQPDPALSDPGFLDRLTGAYTFGPFDLVVDLKGASLLATGTLGSFELVPRLGLRFGAARHPEVGFEFVLDSEGVAREVVVEPMGVFVRKR